MKHKDQLAPEQKRTIDEIQRVAKFLNVDQLSKRDFDRHHKLGGVSTAGYQFGSWNEAVKAAGLIPYPSRGGRVSVISDQELLEEIIRLHKQLGEPPSERKMAALGIYSPKPYNQRWGTFTKARDAAYELLGLPEGRDGPEI